MSEIHVGSYKKLRKVINRLNNEKVNNNYFVLNVTTIRIVSRYKQ